MFFLILPLIGAVSFLVGCGSGGESERKTEEYTISLKTNQGTDEGKVDYYTCTMHPSVRGKDPGNCPICAMNLKPVYKEGSVPTTLDTGKVMRTVSIPPFQQQLIGIQWDTVKVRQAKKVIRTIGHVVYNESQVASVNLKFSGWIEKLYADYAGQFVGKGEPLFEIYSPELVSTQKEYLQLYQSLYRKLSSEPDDSKFNNHGNDTELLDSARQRLLLWGISSSEIERIRKNGQLTTLMTFDSPINGHVIKKNATKGSHVNAGTDLYIIADLSSVWIIADIYEYELPLIKVGQEAFVSLSYDPSAVFTGKIDYIYPTLQEGTRTARVRLVIANSDLKLKPEMYANIEINVDLGEQLTIAQTAVLDTGLRQLVFVDRDNGRFQPREVKLGLKVGHYFTVLAGLEPGEVVVKSGNFLIDAEAHVQGVLQSM